MVYSSSQVMQPPDYFTELSIFTHPRFMPNNFFANLHQPSQQGPCYDAESLSETSHLVTI